MIALIQLVAFLGNKWHLSVGPWGWWIWTEWPHTIGFGWNMIEGFTSYFRR